MLRRAKIIFFSSFFSFFSFSFFPSSFQGVDLSARVGRSRCVEPVPNDGHEEFRCNTTRQSPPEVPRLRADYLDLIDDTARPAASLSLSCLKESSLFEKRLSCEIPPNRWWRLFWSSSADVEGFRVAS